MNVTINRRTSLGIKETTVGKIYLTSDDTINHCMSLCIKATTVGKFYLTSAESASMMSISILLLFFSFGIASMPRPFTEGKHSLKEPSPFAIILEDFALFATSLTKWVPSATWTYNMTNNVKNDETTVLLFYQDDG